MDVIGIIAVGCFGAVAILLSLGFTAFLIIRAFRGPGAPRSKSVEAEETRLIQEIYHGMTKLADRVEALETLLVDDERKKKASFDEELRRGQG